jgi:hypothetical protein
MQVQVLFERKAFIMPNQDADLYWATVGWPLRLERAVEVATSALNQARVCPLPTEKICHLC